MPKASEIKKNTAVEYDGQVYVIKDIDRSVPQGRAGGSIYRMRMYNVVTGAKIDQTFKDGEMLNLADLERRTAKYSYMDGNECVFMDDENYTPYNFKSEDIADEMLFINEDTDGIHVVLVDGEAVALELPQSVDLEIIETDPSIKGASATSRTKPAKLSTGLTVQVPEYIATGERIRVNTEEVKFMGRAD